MTGRNFNAHISSDIEQPLQLKKKVNKDKIEPLVEPSTKSVFEFIHQKVESKGIEPMVLIELMSKSDWNNSSLWEQMVISSSSKTLRKLEERYGLVFDHVKGFNVPVVTAILGASRDVYAIALDGS